MLRACPSRDKIINDNDNNDLESNISGLRRCPSVENLMELSFIEENRLERETNIKVN